MKIIKRQRCSSFTVLLKIYLKKENVRKIWVKPVSSMLHWISKCMTVSNKYWVDCVCKSVCKSSKYSYKLLSPHNLYLHCEKETICKQTDNIWMNDNWWQIICAYPIMHLDTSTSTPYGTAVSTVKVPVFWPPVKAHYGILTNGLLATFIYWHHFDLVIYNTIIHKNVSHGPMWTHIWRSCKLCAS